MKKNIIRLFKLVISVILYEQGLVFQNVNAQSIVQNAQSRFDKFNNVNGGWCAGDATISLILPESKTLWLFGDTFIGQKTGDYGIDRLRSKMINNSAILEDSSGLNTFYEGTFGNPASFIPGEGQNYYWPEHGIIENDTIKIFAVQVTYQNNGTAGFNFKTGTTFIASFKYPYLEYLGTKKIRSLSDTTMRFGACVIKSGDYNYIFGVKDTTSGGYTYPLPYLARVQGSIENQWQFFAGSDKWSYNCKDAVPVGDRPMSESFFVLEKNNKFYLIMHEIWMVGSLYILESDKITGPWNRYTSGGNENKFSVITPHTGSFTYNLFAHPQFQDNGRILISFNVNTTTFNSIYSDDRNYRARFYWLDVDKAATASVPDTINPFDVPAGIDLHYSDTDKNRILYNPETKSLTIAGIESRSMLNIFCMDGRLYIRQEISGDTVIDCHRFHNQLIIIRLEGKFGVETKKIIII